MKPEQLLSDLEREPIAPVYYLHGPEGFFKDRALRILTHRIFPGGAGRDLNYHVLSGKEIKGDAVVREARTLPMFSPQRLLLLRQVDRAQSAELEPLVPYLKAPSPSTCLVLMADGKIDGRTTLGRTLSRKAVTADCRHPYENRLPPLLRRMADEHEIRLSWEVEAYLIEVVGTSLHPLEDAIERLRLFTGKGATVDLDTARKCIADTRVHQIWDLTNALGERNLEQALRILSRLRSDGLEALRALPMLARTVRQLLTAKSLGEAHLSPDAIAKGLGLPPFIARKVAQQARRFSTPDLARALHALHRADLTLKSSDLPSSVRGWVVLEELVWSLAQP